MGKTFLIKKEKFVDATNQLKSPFRPEGFDFSNLDELQGARCLDCGERFFPPRPACLSCSGTNLEPISVSKYAKIYSYTVIHRASAGFPTPYGCGWVVTDDGIKLWAMFKGPIDQLRVGLPMRIVFDKLADNTIYYFEPANGA
jgi:uncharacterized OB-fold protein